MGGRGITGKKGAKDRKVSGQEEGEGSDCSALEVVEEGADRGIMVGEATCQGGRVGSGTGQGGSGQRSFQQRIGQSHQIDR